MRRKQVPFRGRRYLIDTNPLSKSIHDLDHEKQSCSIEKIIEPHVKMSDTLSQVNLHLLLNPDYTFCRCCFNKNSINS